MEDNVASSMIPVHGWIVEWMSGQTPIQQAGLDLFDAGRRLWRLDEERIEAVAYNLTQSKVEPVGGPCWVARHFEGDDTVVLSYQADRSSGLPPVLVCIAQLRSLLRCNAPPAVRWFVASWSISTTTRLVCGERLEELFGAPMGELEGQGMMIAGRLANGARVDARPIYEARAFKWRIEINGIHAWDHRGLLHDLIRETKAS